MMWEVGLDVSSRLIVSDGNTVTHEKGSIWQQPCDLKFPMKYLIIIIIRDNG